MHESLHAKQGHRGTHQPKSTRKKNQHFKPTVLLTQMKSPSQKSD